VTSSAIALADPPCAPEAPALLSPYVALSLFSSRTGSLYPPPFHSKSAPRRDP
jgi:hypothetical protein